ncbi:MAG: hypothetical protein J5968_05200 [Oscillospiraceae bacterium]|nr:hypothetical protein [Oscillospiraceae bacterium]
MERKKVILIALAAVILAIGCGYSHIYQLGAVKGPAVQLADFTDTPYDEDLGKISKECVFDLNFDGNNDSFWFDRNYPLTINGEYPLVLNFNIAGEQLRLDKYDVKEIHSLVLADLNKNDNCCDVILSITQGADNAQKTSIVNIPHSSMRATPTIKRLLAAKFQRVKADCWHLAGADGDDRKACMIDGIYQGISEDGCIMIGELKLRPERDYILAIQTNETNTKKRRFYHGTY